MSGFATLYPTYQLKTNWVLGQFVVKGAKLIDILYNTLK